MMSYGISEETSFKSERRDASLSPGGTVRYARFAAILSLLLASANLGAQVNVLTVHNDIARTGQNLNETILTPANVSSNQFGKLFSQPVDSTIRAQPLYVSQVTIPGKGVHNVVYVGSANGTVYAFDADTNGGVDANPLWKTSLLKATTGSNATVYTILGTPTIDLSSNTMYIAAMTLDNGNKVARLHALDITTGAEKFGAPVLIQGSIPGTGSGSTNGTLAFDASLEIQRAGLLLMNGVLYVSYASLSDNGSWHGWIFSYKASNLQLINIYCTSPNGSGAGIWMGGAGLAGEVNDPAKPYGRMFFVTGNGGYSASKPYNNTMTYGMSVLDLDLSGGVMTVEDEFTPFNAVRLSSQDGDLGSGGVVLLPTQTKTSGGTLSPLVQVGKFGEIAILDRNNLGGYNTGGDKVAQEVMTPPSGESGWGEGIWGTPAYWNNNLYFGGVPPGGSSSLTAYSFVNGVLSSSPTSQSAEQFAYPSPTPSVSSNGTENGIVWVIKNDGYTTNGPSVLLAYDATNLANLLYVSSANFARDNPGPAVRFTIPTIANGKVYVGTNTQLSIYGLLGQIPTVTSPVFTPGSGTFTGSQSVTISDSTPGAQIYYTTDGTTPTVNSKLYTGPITVTSSQIITAIANATGYLQGSSTTATYSSSTTTVNPVISLGSGTYSGPQTVTIKDTSPGATIYYTVDGSTPNTSSKVYTTPITVPVSETVSALAAAPGLSSSFVVSSVFDIDPVYTFNFPQGFAQSQSQIQFNGSTGLDDFRLQLTNGGLNEAGSAFYKTPVNIQAFTTDFVFQLSNPAADGITFTIQNTGPTALGTIGAGIGYGSIHRSMCIKFDILNNAGEGPNSTGLFTAGNNPKVPAIDLTGTGIDLHSGDYMGVHMTYDGTNLNMTITDQITNASWSHSFPINIPATVGGNTAYVGFTGSTGSQSASQKITSWSYLTGQPPVPNYPVGFDPIGLTLNGSAALSGTTLELTNGGANEIASAYFTQPVPIGTFTSDFDFQLNQAKADGFTFVIQNAGLSAIGGGSGGLGYSGIPHSVAIKFDIYNNAGEGTDSTGLFQEGAMPTVPSINYSSTLLQLNLGHVDHCHISYDGVTLTWSVTDAFGHRDASSNVTINLPEAVGAYTAYIGFTASSGDGTAVQDILDWTYTSP
jgi:hypothetical protein